MYSSGRECQRAQPSARQTHPPLLPSLVLQLSTSGIFLEEHAICYSSSWYWDYVTLWSSSGPWVMTFSFPTLLLQNPNVSTSSRHVTNLCGLLWSQHREAVRERLLTFFFLLLEQTHSAAQSPKLLELWGYSAVLVPVLHTTATVLYSITHFHLE